MNANDILPVRRVAIDSRFGQPLSGAEYSGSHFAYQLPFPLNFQKGTKCRVQEATFPHGVVDNVPETQTNLYYIERQPSFDFQGRPTNRDFYLSLIHI